MAQIFPFQPYRYSAEAGPLENLVTQPYDKITPAMRERYLGLSPYNLVRVILGKRSESDTGADNVYTRAAAHLNEWIGKGVLRQDSEPGLFAYYQEFSEPDTGERLVRKGFIGLGAVEEYSANVVYRHEQTLSGPKKDRLELLRHTHAHFGQLFMLYPDPSGEIDTLLDEAAQALPEAEVTDEYGAVHRLWKIAGGEPIRRLMAGKKLLIADGHHRYETALAFRREYPVADRVMMTFVNMHSPGVRILATHRLVSGIPGFDLDGFLRRTAADFRVAEVDSPSQFRGIGVAAGERLFDFQPRDVSGELDVKILHERLLAGGLGITAEKVREEKNLRYMRGLNAAIDEARSGAAQIAFLLRPVAVEEVGKIALAGGVMPQKSTDFYPKLLSGLTIYKID